MTEFVEGELAVLQNASYFEEWDGSLAVIIGPLALRYSCDMHSMRRTPRVCYVVRPLVRDAVVVNCEPYQLRKIYRSEPVGDEQVDARTGSCALTTA